MELATYHRKITFCFLNDCVLMGNLFNFIMWLHIYPH